MDTYHQILILDDINDLSTAAAKIFTGNARRRVNEKGYFTVAISGGATPRHMHRLLTKDPYYSSIPWDETYIFWVDDCCVSINDPASNYGTAKKDFLDQVPLNSSQIFNIPVELPAEDGSIEYQKKLKDFFKLKENDKPSFDLIFLGIGTDGHTASLFPGDKAIGENYSLVSAVKDDNSRMDRITMTLPVLNNAVQTVFLVTGIEKAKILTDILENKDNFLPAQLIRPISKKLIWLVDKDAASILKKEKP